MKSLFNKYIWLQLILSILLLFGGALIIAFAIMGKDNILEDGLNIISAVILFLFGGFAILATLVFEQNKYLTNGLLYGSACIALGVFLCMKEMILLNYLVYLLAIFFIVIGGVELIKAIILVTRKEKNVPAIVIAFVVAALFIAGGILALIFKDNVRKGFCIVAGALLALAGVWELFLGVKTMIGNSGGYKKKEKKKKKNKDVEPEPQAEENEEVAAIENKEEIKELDYTTEENK